MKHFIFIIIATLILASCRSVDMERRVQDTGLRAGRTIADAVFEELPEELRRPQEPPVVIIERPVFIHDAPAPPRPAAARGQQAVRQSNAQGIMEPVEFSYAAMIYDFHPDWVYQVFTQPLRITSIRLEPGERVIDVPIISDSERWMVGAGISYSNGAPVQHIYVRPTQASLQATMIINTDRRVYHIILRSFNDLHMPMVRWRYPSTGLPSNFIPVTRAAAMSGDGQDGGAAASGINLDPRFLSFDYRVTHSLFRRPSWFPELVFDDGRQTYIVFPVGVLQATLPAVFDDRNNVVNYRVFEHVIIIDRLIERATIRLDGRQVVIEKRGRR
ncbi:MAG: TrbG/VirB9 family P-type conjugative transfer protein [Treponema sp.]|nr:TrbG/VirB9 family P-type conjugative transfer protein [Treponema sp.]